MRAHKEWEEVAGRGVRHLVNYKNSCNNFTLDIFLFPNNIKVLKERLEAKQMILKKNNNSSFSLFMAAEKLHFPAVLAQTQVESTRFNPLFIFIVSYLSSEVLFLQSSPSFKKYKS